MERFVLSIKLVCLSVICFTLARDENGGNEKNITSSMLTRQHFGYPDRTSTSPLILSDRNNDEQVIQNFFIQKLDHFNDKITTTWSQRFFEDATYFKTEKYKAGDKRKLDADDKIKPKEDRPVFLMIGAEGAIDEVFFSTGMFNDLAKEHYAYCFALEHRYYGESRPLSDLSIENLKYLTVAQALADLEEFIKYVKEKEKDFITSTNKWIAFGGSYSGALAAWLRKKYPTLVYGAVASSAVFPKEPVLPEFYDRMNKALIKSGSSECNDAIEKATEFSINLIKSENGCVCITKHFNIEPLDFCKNIDDVSVFYSKLYFVIENYLLHDENGFSYVCETMNLKQHLIRRLAILFTTKMEFKTVSVKYETFIANNFKSIEFHHNSFNRQWLYQQCTEFGNIPTFDLKKKPLGDQFDKKFALKICSDVFGAGFSEEKLKNGISTLKNDFGGLDTFYDKTVFPVGELDFWLDAQTTNKINNVIMIERGLHCSDALSCGPSDLEGMKKAKIEFKEQVKKLVEGTYSFQKPPN